MYFELKSGGKTKINHNEFFEKIPKLISINFCGFNIDKDDPGYKWRFGLVELERESRRMVPEVEIYFIELPKFKRRYETARVEELNDPLDKWLYFFVLCDTKEKLEKFINLNKGLFDEYEEKIERVSEMQEFVERYRSSLTNTIIFMTPAEELDEMKSELEIKNKEIEAKNKEIEELRKKLNDYLKNPFQNA